MNPGRELDALVATKVMGWRRMSYHQTQPTNKYYADRHELTMDWYGSSGKAVFLAEPSDCIDCGTDFPAWSPSTDIKHAWLVVEKLGIDKLWTIRTGSPSIKGATTTWTHQVTLGGEQTFGESAPHAICLAALRAVNNGNG